MERDPFQISKQSPYARLARSSGGLARAGARYISPVGAKVDSTKVKSGVNASHVVTTKGRNGSWAHEPKLTQTTHVVGPSGSSYGSNTKQIGRGKLTRAGKNTVAGVSIAGTGGGLAARKKHKVGKSMSDPFEINKKYNNHNSSKNSRLANTGVGAASGAVGGGTVLGGVGVTGGVMAGRAGVRDLARLGAKPGKLRAVKIVGEHAGRFGAKGAAAGGVIGGVYGAGLGATLKAKKRKSVKKSAFGVEDNRVSKADRRMGGQAQWSGHLPKHTSGAVAAAKSATRNDKMPRAVKPGLRMVGKLK